MTSTLCQTLTLTWYGTAGLILRDGEHAIAFDPFCGLPIGQIKNPPQHLPNEAEYRSISDIFVTHGHFDHIYHIPRLFLGAAATIHCTATPCKTLVRNGFDRSRIDVISPSSVVTVGPFSVKAYQGRHCVFDIPIVLSTILRKGFFSDIDHLMRLIKLNRTYPENGEILFYEVECRGTRVQIMGSMNLDSATEYPTNADVLVLPLQGRSDQNVYALDLVKRLMPKSIILDHTDNSFPPMSDDIDASGFIKNVYDRFGIPCRQLCKSKETNIII